MNENSICLLNDSFPPLIDGVANCVVNYAANLAVYGYKPIVVTPSHPNAADYKFDYDVIRYPSISTQKFEGYPAGIPFSPEVSRKLENESIALLHSHCPIMSTFMARQLRAVKNVPLVFTYHTKFDIDIANITKNKQLQQACKKAIVANISACDEVWVVSNGAGAHLRSLGYEGNYTIMRNGVDLPRQRRSPEEIQRLLHGYDLPCDVPVYLFVGRLMWYKGIRIILDALARMGAQDRSFRMIFVGTGEDQQEIMDYAAQCGIGSRCIFTGAVNERSVLQAWYSRADLFLFPSTFDTNGLVVREASACDLPSVLIRGSCAAEDITDAHNGFLIDENADSLYECLCSLSREKTFQVGVNAGNELYLHWSSAVAEASERYSSIIENYRQGKYPRRNKPMDGFMKLNGELMDALAHLSSIRHS